MPNIKRFSASSVRMYADDHHPPHFHIVDVDFQVLVRISDLAVIGGEAKNAQLAEAMEYGRVLTVNHLRSNGLN